MKIRIVIQDYEMPDTGSVGVDAAGMMVYAARQRHIQVWSGEIDIERDNIYVTKISIIADGEPQPICDVPFSLNRGYYMWVPPHVELEEDEEFTVLGSEGGQDVGSAAPQAR